MSGHCRKTKPELILLDVMMPEMDGIETFSISIETRTDDPIIFTTKPINLDEALAQYSVALQSVCKT